VSLNNRISIRNAYGSRVNGKVFDCQVVSVACSTRSEATKDITTQVAEGPEIEQPVAETEVEEGKGESCDRHIIVLPFLCLQQVLELHTLCDADYTQ
jgi:hypothetical protein